jgi:hypothetical protein
MHGVELFGQRLAAREFGRQVAKSQARVTVLSDFTAVGKPIAAAVGWVSSVKGDIRPSADRCR